MKTVINIFSAQLWSSAVVTDAGLDRTSSGSLVCYQDDHKKSQNNPSSPQPRVLNTSNFRVVCKYRLSPVLEENYPLADHTLLYQSIV